MSRVADAAIIAGYNALAEVHNDPARIISSAAYVRAGTPECVGAALSSIPFAHDHAPGSTYFVLSDGEHICRLFAYAVVYYVGGIGAGYYKKE